MRGSALAPQGVGREPRRQAVAVPRIAAGDLEYGTPGRPDPSSGQRCVLIVNAMGASGDAAIFK